MVIIWGYPGIYPSINRYMPWRYPDIYPGIAGCMLWGPGYHRLYALGLPGFMLKCYRVYTRGALGFCGKRESVS